MTSRRTRVLAGLASTALALGISGCSADNAPQPGAAAVVNGEAIEVGALDSLVDAQCDYLSAAKVDGQPVQPITITQMRAQLLDFLVTAEIIEQDVEARDLTIHPGDVEEQVPPLDLPPGMAQVNRRVITGLTTDVARRDVGMYLISSHLLDPKVTSSATMTDKQTNQDYIARLLRRADVKVNPQYGTWAGVTVRPGSGSLSVGASNVAQRAEDRTGEAPVKVSGMPSSQYCG